MGATVCSRWNGRRINFSCQWKRSRAEHGINMWSRHRWNFINKWSPCVPIGQAWFPRTTDQASYTTETTVLQRIQTVKNRPIPCSFRQQTNAVFRKCLSEGYVREIQFAFVCVHTRIELSRGAQNLWWPEFTKPADVKWAKRVSNYFI